MTLTELTELYKTYNFLVHKNTWEPNRVVEVREKTPFGDFIGINFDGKGEVINAASANETNWTSVDPVDIINKTKTTIASCENYITQLTNRIPRLTKMKYIDLERETATELENEHEARTSKTTVTKKKTTTGTKKNKAIRLKKKTRKVNSVGKLEIQPTTKSTPLKKAAKTKTTNTGFNPTKTTTSTKTNKKSVSVYAKNARTNKVTQYDTISKAATAYGLKNASLGAFIRGFKGKKTQKLHKKTNTIFSLKPIK